MSTAIEKRIADLRAQRIALLNEASETEAQQRSRNEVATYVRKWAAERAEAGTKRLALHVANLATGQDLRDVLKPRGQTTTIGVAVDLSDLLAGLIGAEGLAGVLLRALPEVPEGLDAKPRQERLARIAADLDKLEREEERLIVKAEAVGTPIWRRADARPEIVLALQEPEA